MGLSQADRNVIEDVIDEVQFCAQKYLDTGKDIHRKMFEVSLSEGIDYFTSIATRIDDDDAEQLLKYRLHMFVPMQLSKLLELKDEEATK
jgi:hypothetical protein